MSNETQLDSIQPITEPEVENLGYIEEEQMVADKTVETTQVEEENKVEDPIVDPTGTFVDWKKFDQTGFSTTGQGEARKDYIPLPETDDENYKILKPNPNVHIKHPIFSSKPPRNDIMPMFNFVGTEAELFSALVLYDIAAQRKKKEYSDDHSEVLDNCAALMVPDNYLWKSQWRPGARWTNVPVLEGKQVHMGPRKSTSLIGSIQESVPDHRLGTNVMLPMWHSGFHVRLKTPTGKQFAELDAIIASEKNVFGRRNGGALFSNTRCYMESALLDIFLDCVESTTIAAWTPEVVRRLLDNRDLQLAALALQAAKYPSNYPAFEPCAESEAGCREVKSTSFTPMNALIVDEARLTNIEARHMCERFVMRTEQQIIDFQKSASWNQTTVVDLTETISLRLRHPKAVDSINSGYVWASNITQSVHRVLGDDSPSRNRVNFINNLIDTENMRRFVAYIDAVIQNGEEKEATEEEVMALLEQIGDDSIIMRRLELDIRDFEDRDIIAYMATPRYLCAKCETRLSVKDPERLKAYNTNPILVPQDAVTRFFMSRRR